MFWQICFDQAWRMKKQTCFALAIRTERLLIQVPWTASLLIINELWWSRLWWKPCNYPDIVLVLWNFLKFKLFEKLTMIKNRALWRYLSQKRVFMSSLKYKYIYIYSYTELNKFGDSTFIIILYQNILNPPLTVS